MPFKRNVKLNENADEWLWKCFMLQFPSYLEIQDNMENKNTAYGKN